MKRIVLSASILLAALFILFPANASVDRPPQFVVISFDNCGELDRWREISDFLAAENAGGERIKFTFFVSGTNFLPSANRANYRGPGQQAGIANIAFGGSNANVEQRIDFINRLHREGNEIASHAVGHFDGRAWPKSDWIAEFHAYRNLFERAGRFSFSASEIAGFRAPYLGRSPELYSALKELRFRYDASGVGDARSWPEKIDGVWRFNLASLRIAGSGRQTLSMDYNFLVAQSGITGNPKMTEVYRDQMLRTYLAYFRSNYAGNRAPVHIGHHFSPMQGGAYDSALKAFARTVCRLHEVRCVTYAKLADYLDGLDGSTLRAYQRGDFPRAPEPHSDLLLNPLRGAL